MPVDEGGSMNPYAAVKWIWIVYLGVCVLASLAERGLISAANGDRPSRASTVLRGGSKIRNSKPSLCPQPPAIQYLGILLTLVPHVI